MRDTSKIHIGIRVSQMYPERYVSEMQDTTCEIDKFYVVSPAVPNGAGDHRAPRTPPWQGAVRLRAPYEPPPHA